MAKIFIDLPNSHLTDDNATALQRFNGSHATVMTVRTYTTPLPANLEWASGAEVHTDDRAGTASALELFVEKELARGFAIVVAKRGRTRYVNLPETDDLLVVEVGAAGLTERDLTRIEEFAKQR